MREVVRACGVRREEVRDREEERRCENVIPCLLPRQCGKVCCGVCKSKKVRVAKQWQAGAV